LANSASNTATRGPTIRRPAARSNASTKPSKGAFGPYPQPKPSPSCNSRSTHSWPTTTAFARTEHYDGAPPSRRSTIGPRPSPAAIRSRRTTACAYDKIDAGGVITLRHNSRLHHIGLSKHLRGTKVIVLIDDLDIRVLHRDTGQLIRKLILDPTRDYQPRGVKCGNSPENRIEV
jgi:hypothetical protein